MLQLLISQESIQTRSNMMTVLLYLIKSTPISNNLSAESIRH